MNNNELHSPDEIEVEANMDSFRFFAGYTSENRYEFNNIESKNISGRELSRIVYDMKESRRVAKNTYNNWNLEVYRDGEDLRYTAEIGLEEGEYFDDEDYPPAFTNSFGVHPEPEALRQEGTLEVTGKTTEKGVEYLME